ncbi:MAG: hypothetical protein HY700_18005 [Gemmatimonadetes bacterium]|nr:hypothetical protein [Gemmatimonadota bacterium]
MAIRPSDHPTIVCLWVLLLVAAPLTAQQTFDFQLHGLATVFANRFTGGGVGIGLRPPGRSRVAMTGSAGGLDGRVAGRVEGVLSFHLNPGRERGFSPYAAAGLAAIIARQATKGYVEVLLGLEERPGRRSGLFLEVGIGGGMRVAAGYRVRWGKGINRGPRRAPPQNQP